MKTVGVSAASGGVEVDGKGQKREADIDSTVASFGKEANTWVPSLLSHDRMLRRHMQTLKCTDYASETTPRSA